jgi:DNA-binding transcriptional ArsR family regulator
MNTTEVIKVCSALASDKRLQVLEWLANPTAHFPPQRDGDLIEDGVCAVFIAEKLGITPPTTSRHMGILVDAGLVKAKAQKGWTFYRLDPAGMARASTAVNSRLDSATSAPTSSDRPDQ